MATRNEADGTGSIVLGTFIPPFRRTYSFTTADHFGKQVAHRDLLRASIEHNAASRVLVFSRTILPRLLRREYSLHQVSALEDFSGGSTERCEFLPLDRLPEVARSGNCRFISSGPEAARIAELRWWTPRALLPITTVVHALGWADLWGSYLSLLATSEPYDTIVATSRAAETAVRTILDNVDVILRLRSGPGHSGQPELVRIPLGVPEKSFELPDKAHSRRALEISPEDIVILYLGRLTEEYKADLEPLIVAFRNVVTHVPASLLLIAGQDAEKAYVDVIRQYAREAGVQARVRIVENFPYCMKTLLYAAADVFVSPVDNVQESFGLAVVEAMAAGLPVVGTDWSGYRDIVVHGETGFLVRTYWDEVAAAAVSAIAPLESSYGVAHYVAQHTVFDVDLLSEHLLLLAQNPDLRRQLGQRGASRARSCYSWPVLIRRYAEVWERQRERFHESETVRRRPPVTDYNVLFRHYASASLNERLLVHCTRRGQESLVDWSHSDLSNTLPDAVARRARLMLSLCQSTPRELRDLISDAEMDWNCAVGLLKKGYLGLARG